MFDGAVRIPRAHLADWLDDDTDQDERGRPPAALSIITLACRSVVVTVLSVVLVVILAAIAFAAMAVIALPAVAVVAVASMVTVPMAAHAEPRGLRRLAPVVGERVRSLPIPEDVV